MKKERRGKEKKRKESEIRRGKKRLDLSRPYIHDMYYDTDTNR